MFCIIRAMFEPVLFKRRQYAHSKVEMVERAEEQGRGLIFYLITLQYIIEVCGFDIEWFSISI